MDRLTRIEIGGYSYPLNFSVFAASKTYERFGDVDGMQERVMNGFSGKSIEDTFWMLELLAEQGAEYEKIRNNVEIEKLNVEGLQTIFGIREFNMVRSKIMEAVTNSVMQTVEIKPAKNAGTTQGEENKRALRGFGFMDAFLEFLKRK